VTKPKINARTLLRLIGSALSIALLLLLIERQGWSEILVALRQITSQSLVLILILIAISRTVVAARWYALLSAVAPEVSFSDSLKVTFAGLFAANFLPTTVGGDVVRLAAVAREVKDRAGGITSIAVDRLVGLAGMGLMLPFGIIRFIDWYQKAQPSQASVTITWIVPFCALVLIATPDSWLKKTSSSIGKVIREMLIWISRPRALALAFLFTFIHMASIFTITWIVMRDMREGIAIWDIAGLWSFTYFVSLIPISINGLGLREVSIGFIFPELGGISIGAAITTGVLLRTLEVLGSLPGILFISPLLSSVTMGKDDHSAAPQVGDNVNE
jgi:uncharacterized membrane protein YbhN (UPF0104 family)